MAFERVEEITRRAKLVCGTGKQNIWDNYGEKRWLKAG